MRHINGSDREGVGPVRRVLGGLFMLVAAPVFIGIALIALPFMLVARLLGFRGPKGRFAKHGAGCRGRSGPGQSGEATADVAA